MNILALKLILAPVIIGSASLAGRKWGAAVSGWLVGLPLTSGPVAFIIAVSHERAFAFETVRGTLSGGFSLVAFALTYTRVSKKHGWLPSILVSILVFASMTTILQSVVISFIPLFFAVVAVLLIGLRLMPEYEIPREETPHSKWDIPSRILIGTSFILLITGVAPYIGARLTGLLTTIPLYISILTIFAHRHHGMEGGANVLRGMILGIFSFAGFYLALGLLIVDYSLAVSFGTAICTALLVQGASLIILRGLHKPRG